jgi:hypothetical protein
MPEASPARESRSDAKRPSGAVMGMGDTIGKLKTRERVILGLAALVLLALALDMFAVRPVLRALAAMDADIAGAEAVLEANRNILALRESIGTEYAAVKPFLTAGGSPAEEADKMAAEIDALLRGHGIEVPSMGGMRPVEKEAYTVYAVEIKTYECDMAALLRFLYACHESPGLLRVTKMTLAPSPAADGRVQGSMLITKVMTRE